MPAPWKSGSLFCISPGGVRPGKEITMIRELINIVKDIKSGALPSTEVPGFMLWALKKSRRTILFALIVAGTVLWVRANAGK